MIQLDRKQAAKALGISLRTLSSRMKDGTVQYSKIEGAKIGQQSVFFTYAQLNIAPPSPAPLEHDVKINVEYDDPPTFVPRPLTREELDEKFAADYLSGSAEDSCGNTITGNERWPTKGKVTLLGPQEPHYNPPPDTSAHMTPGTFGGTPMIGSDGEVVSHAGASNHPLNSERMYEAFHKPGQPSYAELHGLQVKLPHPNALRNEYFKNIFRDIRLGWSR